MAEKSKDFGPIGSYGRGSVLETVEIKTAALTSADVGKPLKATGVNSDGQMQVEVAGSSDHVNYVAILESVGAVGDLIQVLLRGDVVIKQSDGAITAGSPVTNKGGKFILLGTSGMFVHPLGFARVTFADGDSGLICFTGM